MFAQVKNGKVLLNNQYLNDYLNKQIKEFLTGLIEKMIEVEFYTHIKRDKYERISKTGIRQYRNGYRKRNYLTRFCIMMEIKIPRCRPGSFNPKLFQNKGILDPALEQLLIHQWSDGNSYRDIQNFVETIYGERISLASIHRMTKKIDKYVKEFHQRKMEKSYDAIYIDGLEICLKDHEPKIKNRYGNKRYVRIGKNMVLLGVLGQRREGKKIIREVLDYQITESENTESYSELLLSLKKRGLSREKFKLAIHDGEESISAALRLVYGKGKVLEQECMFHKLMNIMKTVKDDRNQEELRKDIWNSYSQKDFESYMKTKEEVIEKWSEKEPEAITSFEKSDEKMITKYKFDERMHKSIHTNNPIERYFRELRRRIKAIGIFENKESADRLIFLMVESINQKRGSLPISPDLKFTH